MQTLYFCPVVSFFFYSSPNLSGRRLDVYHTTTHGVCEFWMHVWNVLHAARWKYRTQKWRKNRHLRTTAQVCLAVFSQLRHVSTIGKELLISGISCTSLHSMVNFGRLLAEICWRVWAPQQISTGFASCLRYCSDVAHRRPTNLCTFGCLLGWYIIYTLLGALASDRILPGAKFTLHATCKSCVRLYWQRCSTALQ